MPPKPAPAPAPARDARGRFVASGKPTPATTEGRLGWLRRFLWSGVVLGGVAIVGAAASDTIKDALKGGVRRLRHRAAGLRRAGMVGAQLRRAAARRSRAVPRARGTAARR